MLVYLGVSGLSWSSSSSTLSVPLGGMACISTKVLSGGIGTGPLSDTTPAAACTPRQSGHSVACWLLAASCNERPSLHKRLTRPPIAVDPSPSMSPKCRNG